MGKAWHVPEDCELKPLPGTTPGTTKDETLDVIRVKVFEQKKHKVFKTEGIRNGIPCKNGENMANSTQIFNYGFSRLPAEAMLVEVRTAHGLLLIAIS